MVFLFISICTCLILILSLSFALAILIIEKPSAAVLLVLAASPKQKNGWDRGWGAPFEGRLAELFEPVTPIALVNQLLLAILHSLTS